MLMASMPMLSLLSQYEAKLMFIIAENNKSQLLTVNLLMYSTWLHFVLMVPFRHSVAPTCQLTSLGY